MKSLLPYPRILVPLSLGALSLFSLFCASNIIWMQTNTQIESIITSPEIFVQRDSSTVVISGHEIMHSLERYIEDYDFGLYFDIPSSFWESSYLNEVRYRFTSQSSKETTLMLYVEDEDSLLNGFGFDEIDSIHWSFSHREPPEVSYITHQGEEVSQSIMDSIQVIEEEIGCTENILDYDPDYSDYYLVIHSVDGSGVEARVSLGVRMPVFSLLRNIFLFLALASGLIAVNIRGRFDEY